jgi:hypothetical protein
MFDIEPRSLISLLNAAKNSQEPSHRRGNPRFSATSEYEEQRKQLLIVALPSGK